MTVAVAVDDSPRSLSPGPVPPQPVRADVAEAVAASQVDGAFLPILHPDADRVLEIPEYGVVDRAWSWWRRAKIAAGYNRYTTLDGYHSYMFTNRLVASVLAAWWLTFTVLWMASCGSFLLFAGVVGTAGGSGVFAGLRGHLGSAAIPVGMGLCAAVILLVMSGLWVWAGFVGVLCWVVALGVSAFDERVRLITGLIGVGGFGMTAGLLGLVLPHVGPAPWC